MRQSLSSDAFNRGYAIHPYSSILNCAAMPCPTKIPLAVVLFSWRGAE